MSVDKDSLFEEALKPLKKTASTLELGPEVVVVLRSHERALAVSIPAKMNSG